MTLSVARSHKPPERGPGRRVLACASSGGHFKQLVSLIDRLPNVGEVTWVTYDRGLSVDLLHAAGRGHERLVFAAYAAPRDLPNLSRNAALVGSLLREEPYDLAISTGAGIAVAALPLARAMGVRACFIESATRSEGPSFSGRILQRIPGIELFTQNAKTGPDGYRARWKLVGSVHDGFAPGPESAPVAIRRVVVSLGTIQPYGFGRLINRLVDILPSEAEVLWQTGATDVSDLPIEGLETVPGPAFEAAVEAADVVIAHAGTGTAVTAFERGRCPILVPRRRAHGEHIDDHQVITAEALAARGLALYAEVEQLTPEVLATAAARTIVRRSDVGLFAI